MGAEDFLRGRLAAYYEANEVPAVPEIAMREFGIGEFGRKISSRHMAFRSAAELNQFLRTRAPFYISYSNALYGFPSARPMESKAMKGADLIYEFDADEIKTNCKLEHDSWKCNSRTCLASGKGRLLVCPECGAGTSVDEWVCPECLGAARKQTQRLVASLEKDFGFSQGISLNFSGSKGFHVHVRGEAVRGFSKSARLELLDFLTGTNLDLKSMGFFFDKKQKAYFCPKRGSSKGWAAKIFSSVQAVLDKEDAALLGVMGNVTANSAAKLLKERAKIIAYMDRGLLLAAPGVNAEKFWNSCLGYIVSEEKLDLDRQTSIDINKIIRVPSTIHGGTGLLAKQFPVEGLAGFKPLDDAVVLPDTEIRVMNASAPRFYLNGKWFGPFTNSEATLPGYAAFYLLARGSASLESETGRGDIAQATAAERTGGA